MNLLLLFGIGEPRVIAKNRSAEGRITSVKKCLWLKVNTKPLRKTALDGAVFPHIVRFDYTVDGVCYHGVRFFAAGSRKPNVGARISVWYDPKRPQRYAVSL